MEADNLYLVAGTYSASATAAEDYKALKAGEKAGEYEVVASVVMNRDASGKVEVDEHGDGKVGAGAVLGGTAGLVVGLFAPPLLAATAVGAGIGAVVGKLRKRHEEKQMGVELEDYLPEFVGGCGDRRRPLGRQGPGRTRQLRQADQQGDRQRRLRRAPEGHRAVLRRGLGRRQVIAHFAVPIRPGRGRARLTLQG